CDPGSDRDRAGDVCDRPVGHAEQYELGRLARGDVPRAEASGDGRADAAGADDLDAAEHFELQFRSGYRACEAYTGTGTLAYLVGRRLLLGLLFAVALFRPGKAHAAITLTPCPDKSGVQCGTVDVPIDRSGAVPGTIGLHVEVLPASGVPRGTMFLIAGGPGQGSAGSFNLAPGY